LANEKRKATGFATQSRNKALKLVAENRNVALLNAGKKISFSLPFAVS
jgi:hypothetical protein